MSEETSTGLVRGPEKGGWSLGIESSSLASSVWYGVDFQRKAKERFHHPLHHCATVIEKA